jgi:hypothetical protein
MRDPPNTRYIQLNFWAIICSLSLVKCKHVFMGLVIDSRIKTPDAKIPLLQTEFKVKATEHNYELSDAIVIFGEMKAS